jgi:hypothetical protein
MAFDWIFWFGVLQKVGPFVYNQLVSLFGAKMPTIDDLRKQSAENWAIIAEEEAKL